MTRNILSGTVTGAAYALPRKDIGAKGGGRVDAPWEKMFSLCSYRGLFATFFYVGAFSLSFPNYSLTIAHPLVDLTISKFNHHSYLFNLTNYKRIKIALQYKQISCSI